MKMILFVCQIPLEECERLDQNLALALQHHLTHHRAGPAQVTVTDAHGDTEVSTPLDSRTGELDSCMFYHLKWTRESRWLHFHEALALASWAD